MTDLITRLTSWADWKNDEDCESLCREAAAEIARLRQAQGSPFLADVLRSRGRHNTLHDIERAAALISCPRCAR